MQRPAIKNQRGPANRNRRPKISTPQRLVLCRDPVTPPGRPSVPTAVGIVPLPDVLVSTQHRLLEVLKRLLMGLLSERHGLFVFVLSNGFTEARVTCLDGIARQPPCFLHLIRDRLPLLLKQRNQCRQVVDIGKPEASMHAERFERLLCRLLSVRTKILEGHIVRRLVGTNQVALQEALPRVARGAPCPAQPRTRRPPSRRKETLPIPPRRATPRPPAPPAGGGPERMTIDKAVFEPLMGPVERCRLLSRAHASKRHGASKRPRTGGY